MKKLIAIAVGIVMATPAFAAVQNVKVGGSITSAYVDRNNFDYNVPGAAGKYNQSFFYTSTHLQVSADLSDNVSAVVGLANEMPWGDQNGLGTSGNAQSIDLELANVTMREFLYSPLTLTVGRQTLAYGNDFIIGKNGGLAVGDLANVAKDISRTQNYDGIRAVLDYKPLTLDLVYVKTNSNDLSGGSTNGIGNDDQNLYGINANYQLGDAMNTVAEAYFWARTDDSNNQSFRGVKADTLYVPGLRVSTNPIKDLTVGAEAAMQFGNKVETTGAGFNSNANARRSKVWALQTNASYAIPVMEKYKPTLAASYTYVSGDNLKSGGKYNAWDPMFNDQNLGTRIWRSLYNYSNLHIAELSLSANPLEDVTAKVTWTGLWLADSYTAGGTTTLNMPDGNTATVRTTDNRGLGNEVDGELTYQYTEDVSFGLNLGLFKPGDAFNSANNSVAKEAIVSVGVNF